MESVHVADLCCCDPAMTQHLSDKSSHKRFPLVCWSAQPGYPLPVPHGEHLGAVLREDHDVVPSASCIPRARVELSTLSVPEQVLAAS